MSSSMSPDSEGSTGAVTSAHPYASRSGLSVLKRGGNAVDAAVATAFTLGVVQPAFSGIGGGGFMLIHLADTGQSAVIDYRETAPGAATPNMFSVGEDGEVLDDASSIGFKAVAVPGTLAGYSLALERYGTMTMNEVAQDAIGYAKNGFEVSPFLASIMRPNDDSSFDKLRASGLLLKSDGSAYGAGERLVLTDLGNVIERLANHGIGEFYDGFVAKATAEHMADNGGLLNEADLRGYEPRLREPLAGSYKGLQVVTMPPPSSGGVALIQLFKLFEGVDLKGKGFNTPASIDLMARALEPVYAARQRVADPDFCDVPVERLTSDAFIAELRAEAYTGHASRESGFQGRSQTSHLSVIDRRRNVVALTESLECFFGSGVVAPGTEIFLNDTMHDFDPTAGSLNEVLPGKRPMSSMSPTIFFRDGSPVMVLGSAGGPMIITAVLQVALNVLEHGMDVQDAISAPRFHFRGGPNGPIVMESRLPADVRGELERMGYGVEVRGDFDFYFGGVHAITVDAGGTLHGGADPRRDGAALAY